MSFASSLTPADMRHDMTPLLYFRHIIIIISIESEARSELSVKTSVLDRETGEVCLGPRYGRRFSPS
jgi:hypothetical protein